MTRDEILGTADELVRLVEASDHPPTEREARDLADATLAAARRIATVVRAVPWPWASTTWIDAFQQAFVPARDGVRDYLSESPEERDPAWPLTWEQVGELWAAVALWLPALPLPDAEAGVGDLADYRQRLDRVVDEFARRVGESAEETQALRQQIEELDAHRQRIEEELAAQRQSFETNVAEQTGRLEAAIRQNQEQFSAAQENRSQEFASALTDARDQLRAAVDDVAQEGRSRIGTAEAEAAAALQRLAELERKATRSYHAVGTASVAGHYQAEANRQRSAANIWRIVGMIVGIGTALAGVAELLLGDASPSLDHTVARLPIFLLFAAVAAIAFRESGQHRDMERRLRQREVDLSSIDPYLANISDAEGVEKLKLAHAQHIFLRDPEPAATVDQQEFNARSALDAILQRVGDPPGGGQQ